METRVFHWREAPCAAQHWLLIHCQRAELRLGASTMKTDLTSDSMSEADRTRQTIVVGIDGSEPSRHALRWAYHQAELTRSTLRVVMSWELPSVGLAPFPVGLDPRGTTEEVLVQTLNDTIRDDPSVPITTLVIEGHPAPVLLHQTLDADLLVVGSRGHGKFAELFLGSVSEHVVAHATCPVVVVRTKGAHA